MTISESNPCTSRHAREAAQTHSVFNQPRPRVDINEFDMNTALIEATRHFAPQRDLSALQAIGAHIGSADYQHDAELANTITPVHHSHDRWGNRVNHIEFHPSYHRIME